MAQHDYAIADQAGAAFLTDLNNALAAIVANNSGATEPTTMYAYQWWADTTSGILKQRNAANSAWINILTLSTGMPVLAAAKGANSDITSLSGLTTPLSMAQGGTGVASIPAFRAYATGVTSITSGWVKVSLAGETFDTANAFDSTTNYRFQPAVAGYYLINGSVQFATSSYAVRAALYKNGSVDTYGAPSGFAATSSDVAGLIHLNGSTDYVELYATSATTQNSATGDGITFLSGVMVRGG